MPPARKRKLGGSGGQGHADEKEDEEKLLDGIWNGTHTVRCMHTLFANNLICFTIFGGEFADSSMPVRITQPEDSSSSPSTSTENQEDEERSVFYLTFVRE